MVDFKKLDNRFIRHVNMPSNQGAIEAPSGRAVGVGQCGDSVEVTLRVESECIRDIRYLPRGCAFTIACSSAMSELAQGRTLEQALEISPQEVESELGDFRRTIGTAPASRSTPWGRPLPIATGDRVAFTSNSDNPAS